MNMNGRHLVSSALYTVLGRTTKLSSSNTSKQRRLPYAAWPRAKCGEKRYTTIRLVRSLPVTTTIGNWTIKVFRIDSRSQWSIPSWNYFVYQRNLVLHNLRPLCDRRIIEGLRSKTYRKFGTTIWKKKRKTPAKCLSWSLIIEDKIVSIATVTLS